MGQWTCDISHGKHGKFLKGEPRRQLKKSPSDRLYTAQTGSTASAAAYFKWAATPQKFGVCQNIRRQRKSKFYFSSCSNFKKKEMKFADVVGA